MKPFRSALVALLLTAATAAMPCAAQQAPSSPQALPDEACAGCFAYLVFSPSLEPESYAIRGQGTTTALPAAGEPDDRLGNQTAGLLAPSKQ